MRTSITKHRAAFTLIELLVVIGIILIITALGVTMVPRFQQDQKVQRGADQLQQYLLIAKQRAKRDLLPTGIRLYVDASGLVSQIAYIQQPTPFLGSTANGASNGYLNSAAMVNGVPTVTFDPTTVDLIGGGAFSDQSLVQPGDYLQVSNGNLHQIASVTSSNVLTLVANWPIPGGGTIPDTNNTTFTVATPTPDWHILRGPRRFAGEDLITMYPDMVVDVSKGINLPTFNPISGPAPYTQCIDILFSPTGSVVGQGSTGGKIVLYVRDNTATNPLDPGAALLVAIQMRTGFISAAAVAPGADPYANTKDGRASGL